MKIKTSEATKLQLNWGVANVMRLDPELAFHECYRYGVVVLAHKPLKGFLRDYKEGFSHTDPAVCIGLIKEYCINIQHDMPVRGDIIASIHVASERIGWGQCGDTVEQAVARCVIAMRLGDEFECPDELGVQS